MTLGNGGSSVYTYDAQTRRVAALDTKVRGRTLQKLTYGYDLVGNVKAEKNDLGEATGRRSGTVSYTFDYDKLYRLTKATGTAAARPGVTDSFLSTFEYDDIHNMTWNKQHHEVVSVTDLGTETALPPKTNHDFAYSYDAAHPHQARKIGDSSGA